MYTGGNESFSAQKLETKRNLSEYVHWGPNNHHTTPPNPPPATNPFFFFKIKKINGGIFCEICNQSKTCWNSFIRVPTITKKKTRPPPATNILILAYKEYVYIYEENFFLLKILQSEQKLLECVHWGPNNDQIKNLENPPATNIFFFTFFIIYI